MLSAGKKLRDLREQMGLTLRDVELLSTSLAEIRGIEEFVINPSRLSDIETKGVIPSIFRLYVLSVIYRADFTELLRLYGVDLSSTAADFAICRPGKTHRVEIAETQAPWNFPQARSGLRSSPHDRPGPHDTEKGFIPMQYLQELAKKKFIYAYIGMEDLTMYPLLLPGTFIQVDEERTRVEEKKWLSELDRPVTWWKPAKVTCVAGAPCGEARLCCNPIRFLRCPRGYSSTRRTLMS